VIIFILKTTLELYHFLAFFQVNKNPPKFGGFNGCQLTIAASLHAVSAIYWFVTSWLERQLSDLLSARSTVQIDTVHLARSTVETAATTTITTTFLAESAVAIGAVYWTIT
jgi:hypothetical protein